MSAARLREMLSEATPGPWTVEESICAVDTPDGRALVLMDDRQQPEQALRDARLIALAPDAIALLADAAALIDGSTRASTWTEDAELWLARLDALCGDER